MLKKCAGVLCRPLRALFNLSLRCQRFPECWKRSHLFPVFKKGDKRDIANYRGITSLCAGSKLFEILMGEVLFRELKSYISVEQHGFFPGRSTSTNLLEFTSFCISGMDAGAQIDAVYTDLKAAFDRIDHRILLAKLDRLGVSNEIVLWLQSYLSNRKLSVKIGSLESHSFSNSSGVPQGSNLGPLLFSVFFNDVCLLLPPGCKLVYADDLKLYLLITSIDDCLQLQRLIDSFSAWCTRNFLIVSVSKCSVISFSRKKNDIVYPYSINNLPLTRVSEVRDLGVILDKKLTFHSHYLSIIAKANRK